MNGSGKEIILETRPSIRFNGLPEKYIGLEKDSSNRGLVWKFGPIDCIIIYPLGPQTANDSIGKYIMKPSSGFEVGDFYKTNDVEFSDKCINLNYVKIMTATDTVILSDKKAIWNALNYDKKVKRNRKIFYNKAIIFQ